jgi:hypothetical protein
MNSKSREKVSLVARDMNKKTLATSVMKLFAFSVFSMVF